MAQGNDGESVSFFKIIYLFIYLFLERGHEREKERERNSDVREKHSIGCLSPVQEGLNPQS